jgi:hypothetical protein
MLEQYVVNVWKEWMIGVGLKHFLYSFLARGEQAGFLEAVEFHPDGIARLAKFGGKAPQVRFGISIQEKPGDELNART